MTPATDCDVCAGPISYNETCYSLPNGTTHDDLPVVSIICAACYRVRTTKETP